MSCATNVTDNFRLLWLTSLKFCTEFASYVEWLAIGVIVRLNFQITVWLLWQSQRTWYWLSLRIKNGISSKEVSLFKKGHLLLEEDITLQKTTTCSTASLVWGCIRIQPPLMEIPKVPLSVSVLDCLNVNNLIFQPQIHPSHSWPAALFHERDEILHGLSHHWSSTIIDLQKANSHKAWSQKGTITRNEFWIMRLNLIFKCLTYQVHHCTV